MFGTLNVPALYVAILAVLVLRRVGAQASTVVNSVEDRLRAHDADDVRDVRRAGIHVDVRFAKRLRDTQHQRQQ